jgi:YycE-like protein
VIATFEDHDGYSGVVFGLPDSSRQLELVFREGDLPSPTAEDQLVFSLGSPERVGSEGARIRSAGFDPVDAPNPYWQRTGAIRFLDPDGYSVVSHLRLGE